jgi:hypothetical protein
MVKALVSRSGKDLFDLYFSDVRLFARFVYGEVTVQKPRDFMNYEGLADEVDVSDEIYNLVVNIYEMQERVSDELEKLAALKSEIPI